MVTQNLDQLHDQNHGHLPLDKFISNTMPLHEEQYIRVTQCCWCAHKIEIRLVQAMYNDTGCLSFSRALGLIDKLINGPLWAVLANKKNVLSMNDTYQEVVRKPTQ